MPGTLLAVKNSKVGLILFRHGRNKPTAVRFRAARQGNPGLPPPLVGGGRGRGVETPIGRSDSPGQEIHHGDHGVHGGGSSPSHVLRGLRDLRGEWRAHRRTTSRPESHAPLLLPPPARGGGIQCLSPYGLLLSRRTGEPCKRNCINAMRRVRKNSTGQPWAKPGHDEEIQAAASICDRPALRGRVGVGGAPIGPRAAAGRSCRRRRRCYAPGPERCHDV